MYAYSPFSPHNGKTTGIYESYFSHLLMITLIFNRIIVNILLLHILPYFVYCLLVNFVSFYVLVLTLKLVSELLSSHIHKQELNGIELNYYSF
jgi:hypothetical protein